MPNHLLRVLVLEDHPFQRSFAVTLLQHLGCQDVLVAADGHEAMRVLREVGPVDIAVCDLCMKGMDGLQFLQEVSTSGLVGSVILCSTLSLDLRRAVCQMIHLSGLRLLGDAGKPLQSEVLQSLLERYPQAMDEVVSAPNVAVEISNEQVIEAMKNGQLKVVFQPKFNMLDGNLYGVEALTRWQHPVQGNVPPDRFIPVLERSGGLDDWLIEQLQQGLNLKQEARSAGHTIDVAFNLNSSQLAHRDLTWRIKGALAARQASGAGLTFELTESDLLKTSATCLENLVRLRTMGCGLSIDDFGTGYSSLQRLCQLPFNEIKLDGEFVRSLSSEPRCRAAITSTLALGSALGISVVIEGIETHEQRLQLIALGCTQGQGNFFARPMPAVELLKWLREYQSLAAGVS